MARRKQPDPVWTVTVLGLSARGLTRDFTAYRAEPDRADAEQAALEEAGRRWPASTVPMTVSSYASAHTVHAGADWKTVCQYQERALCGEGLPRCPDHPNYGLGDHRGRPGWCWFGAHYAEVESMQDAPSTPALALVPPAAPEDDLERETERRGERWCLRHHMAVQGGTPCPDSEAMDPGTPCEALACQERAPICYGAPPANCPLKEDETCSHEDDCRASGDPEPSGWGIEHFNDDPPPRPVRPEWVVMDRNTGKEAQLTLTGAEWEAFKVASLRLSVSYSDEFVLELFKQLVADDRSGDLAAGSLVEVTMRGYVVEWAPVYKKGAHEGKGVISCASLQSLKVLGHATGAGSRIEPAQNVDGEPQVISGGPEPAEAVTGPTEALHEPTCANCLHNGTPADQEPCSYCAPYQAEGKMGAWEPGPFDRPECFGSERPPEGALCLDIDCYHGDACLRAAQGLEPEPADCCCGAGDCPDPAEEAPSA